MIEEIPNRVCYFYAKCFGSIIYPSSQYIDTIDVIKVEASSGGLLTGCLRLSRLRLSLGWLGYRSVRRLPFLLGNRGVHLDQLSVEAIACCVQMSSTGILIVVV